MAFKEPRLLGSYKASVKNIAEELQVKNIMDVPRSEKIVVNIGQGEAVQNVKTLEGAVADIEAITGQKAILTKARKSIAGFKLRKGMPIGTSVTLRGARMYEFFRRDAQSLLYQLPPFY